MWHANESQSQGSVGLIFKRLTDLSSLVGMNANGSDEKRARGGGGCHSSFELIAHQMRKDAVRQAVAAGAEPAN